MPKASRGLHFVSALLQFLSQQLRQIGYVLRSGRRSRELVDEMEFHREMATLAGRPVSSFGNPTLLREQAREAWGWTWIDRLLQDLRFATRMLARSPGFTSMVVLVLAIGVGVNVSAFSLFDMMALKPLPVHDPKALVRLERRSPDASTSEMAYPSFVFYREHARTLSAAMAVLGVPPMQMDQEIEPVKTSFVTPNYFAELGTLAAYGRLLETSRDDLPGATPAVVLSYDFWQRRFGGDPSVIGRVIHLNRKPAIVTGVLPYDFASLGGQGPEIWLPIVQQPYFIEGSHVLTDAGDSSIRMWGRLAPGITPKMAEQELLTLTNELRRQHPEAVWDKEYIQSSSGGHLQVMQPEMYRVAIMVGALTLLILTASCANLGGLLLARAVMREHEIGIRIAIGANRLRIFRQLCTESLLLASLGSVAGLALGSIVNRIALTSLTAPRWLSAMPDWRVLLFTVGVTFVASVFFGLAPALQIAHQRQYKTIARQILVGAQVTASCVLLIVAGLLVRAAQHALYTNPGFGYERLLTIDAQLGHHGYAPAAAKAYLDQIRIRLLAMPGAQSVSLVKLPPLGHTVDRERFDIDGHSVLVYPNWVEPGFFETMRIPMQLGRSFFPGEKHAVIVSQSFAQAQWPGRNPLGQQIGDGENKDLVVGVVGNARINAISDDDATEQYWPAQQSDMSDMVLVARTAGDPGNFLAQAKSISESLDPKLFPEIRQLKTLYRDNVSGVEKVAAVVTLIGFVAVSLAGIGIISLVAFTISQRSKEIAIRLALGAPALEALASVLRQYVWPVSLGAAAGLALTAAFSRLLRFGLYGINNLDPLSYASAIALLLAIVALAAFLPARRALKLDIARTLHQE